MTPEEPLLGFRSYFRKSSPEAGADIQVHDPLGYSSDQLKRRKTLAIKGGVLTAAITPDIVNALGFYVYAYIDPRDESVFYIGKGVGARATDHLFDESESKKVARINSIRDAGLEPRIDIVAHQLRDDLESSRVEAALIELIGVHQLTNLVRGRFSTDYPRRPLTDFIMEHSSQVVDVTDSALLIRINREFKYGMSAEALYESTRGIWVVGERRKGCRKYKYTVYGEY